MLLRSFSFSSFSSSSGSGLLCVLLLDLAFGLESRVKGGRRGGAAYLVVTYGLLSRFRIQGGLGPRLKSKREG